MTNPDFPCPLCTAAAEVTDAQAEGADVDMKSYAAKHGVTLTLLKRRLGLSGTRTTWNEETLAALQEYVDTGATTEEIAETYGLSKSRVGQILSKHNIDMEKGRSARISKSLGRAAVFSEMVLAEYKHSPDFSPKQIADALGETESSSWLNATEKEVESLLKSLDLPLGKGKKKAKKKKGTPSTPPADAVVEDVSLPDSEAEIEDDAIQVKEDSPAQSVADYLEYSDDEELPISFESYGEWAVKNNRHSRADVRKEFGSWASAKRSARELVS